MPRNTAEPRYLERAGSCPLSRWDGRVGSCRWCGRPAVPGFDWCGNRCQDDFQSNHLWDVARYVAVTRDGNRCVRCGLGPDVAEIARWFIRALVPMDDVSAARLWESAEWVALKQGCQVEVNHIVPRRGGGYGAGCHHHLDGLETLCHRCHAQVTAGQQREARAV